MNRDPISVLNTSIYRTAYAEKEGKYLLIVTEEETDFVNVSYGLVGSHPMGTLRFESKYLEFLLELSGWRNATFNAMARPMPEKPDYFKKFPMFGVTRQDLLGAGLKESHIDLLTDADMQQIVKHTGDLLLSNGSFRDALTFAAWNLILGTKLTDKTDDTQ